MRCSSMACGRWADFQRQERPWRHALDRAQLLALVILGLCPFIYWHNKLPEQAFFPTPSGAGTRRRAVPVQFEPRSQAARRDAAGRNAAAAKPASSPRFNRWLLVALLFFAIAFIVLLQLPHPSLPRRQAVVLVEPRQQPAADLFHPAAAGDDDGADLENQGSDPRRGFRRAGLQTFTHLPLAEDFSTAVSTR